MHESLMSAFRPICIMLTVAFGTIVVDGPARAATCANDHTLAGFESCFASMNYGQNVWQMTAQACAGQMENARDKIDERGNTNSGAFLVNWFNENMKKIKGRYDKSDRITCEDFFKFATKKYPNDDKIQDAARRFNVAMQPPEPAPGTAEPNERDVVLAVAPYLVAGLNLAGRNCDITRVHGCHVAFGPAQFSLYLERISNIRCHSGEDKELECSFIAKMSCSSSDPTGVFCETFGQPFNYENVRFVRDSSGWRAVPPRR